MILTRADLDGALKRADEQYETARAAADADEIHAAIHRGVRLNRLYDLYEATVTVAVHFPDGDRQMTLREARDFQGLYDEVRIELLRDGAPDATLRATLLRKLALDEAVRVGSENKLDTEFFGVDVDESLFA